MVTVGCSMAGADSPGRPRLPLGTGPVARFSGGLRNLLVIGTGYKTGTDADRGHCQRAPIRKVMVWAAILDKAQAWQRIRPITKAEWFLLIGVSAITGSYRPVQPTARYHQAVRLCQISPSCWVNVAFPVANLDRVGALKPSHDARETDSTVLPRRSLCGHLAGAEGESWRFSFAIE